MALQMGGREHWVKLDTPWITLEGTTGFVPQEKDKMAVDEGYFFSVVRGTIGGTDSSLYLKG